MQGIHIIQAKLTSIDDGIPRVGVGCIEANCAKIVAADGHIPSGANQCGIILDDSREIARPKWVTNFRQSHSLTRDTRTSKRQCSQEISIAVLEETHRARIAALNRQVVAISGASA